MSKVGTRYHKSLKRWIFLCRLCKAVERHAVGAVADAVERDLESGGVARDDHACELFGRHARDAAVAGVVGEGREHGGGARAERAVNVAFERGQTKTKRVVLERGELRALALYVRDRVVELLPLGDAHG